MSIITEVAPDCFLGRGAQERNGVTDWQGKQILKADPKERASSQGARNPCTLPLVLPLNNKVSKPCTSYERLRDARRLS